MFIWQILAAVLAIVAVVIGYFWFRRPAFVFGHPENIADEIYLKWWHVPIEIRPCFFQRKLLNDCAISVYVHGGGMGTIIGEIALCWQIGGGPQKTVAVEKNRKYLVPVSLRSTHWTELSIDVNREKGLAFSVPPRTALFCDRRMMLAARIPMDGLSNEYYLSFRVHRFGKTLQRSGLYKLVIPFKKAGNSAFVLVKYDAEPWRGQ